MNSDRLLILGIPALAALLVHLLFVFALEGGWTTASPTITAQPRVVQASLVSLSKPKPKPRPKPKAVEPKLEPKPAPAPAHSHSPVYQHPSLCSRLCILPHVSQIAHRQVQHGGERMGERSADCAKFTRWVSV